jgi:ABC-type transport system involved in multi-copper enzyme maturation permease subunit
MKLLAIALNTFRENRRDKVLYNLMGFALIMIAASLVMGQLSIAERKKMTIDLSLSSISIIGVIIAVFLGISLVSKEIEKKTIYTLLAKPVERYLFILGRYSGLMITIAINVVIMSAVFALTLRASGGANERNFDWPILQAVILIYVELAIITAAAIFFSTFSSPTLAAIFTIGFFLAGRFTSGVSALFGQGNAFAKKAAQALEIIIPDLTNYVRIDQALYSNGLPPELFLKSIAVGALTASLFLVLAIAVFQRRDFV